MLLRGVCAAHERATRFSVVIGNHEYLRMSLLVLATLAAYSAVGDARRVIPSLLGCMV